jgi:hypothetical protein
MGAVEKPRIEIFLELAYLKGHGGLGHVQGFGGFSETQKPGNGMENLESAVAHGCNRPGNGPFIIYCFYAFRQEI